MNDQEIYNKCLFRTVNYFELKNELMLRNINFSPSDSYYILTLKLRKEILVKSDENSTLVKRISEEIAAFVTNKTEGSKYTCSLVGCAFTCTNHRKYMSHLELVHQNTKSRLFCQFRHNCSRDFPSYKLLETHVKAVHKKRTSHVELRLNQLVERLTNLVCVEKSCGNQVVTSIINFKAHLYSHTDKKEEVQCLFCEYTTNTTGTLQSHLSRKHKIQTVDNLHKKLVKDGDRLVIPPVILGDETGDNDLESVTECDDLSLEEDSDEENDEESDEASAEVFIKALAITVRHKVNNVYKTFLPRFHKSLLCWKMVKTVG